MSEQWECFCDEGYYHKWAVRDKNGSCAFEETIHVDTKAEAEFLVDKLNAVIEMNKHDLSGILQLAGADDDARLAADTLATLCEGGKAIKVKE